MSNTKRSRFEKQSSLPMSVYFGFVSRKEDFNRICAHYDNSINERIMSLIDADIAKQKRKKPQIFER